MPSIAVLAAVPLSLGVLIYHLYQIYVNAKAWDHIPTHEFEDGDNSRERYLRDSKALYESGYRKYSKNGQLFKVAIPVGGYKVKYRVVLPKDHLEEMKHLSNNTFSWALASAVIFAQDYTGGPPRGPWSGKPLRIGIHQNLASITQRLEEEIDKYYAKHLPNSASSTGKMKFMDFFVPAVATVTSTLLVNETLSSDPEWIRQTTEFAVNRYKSADDVRSYPPLIASLVAPFLPSVRKLRASRRYVKEKMEPIYNDLKARDLLGKTPKEEYRKGKFGTEWLWSGAPEDVTLQDFSDTMMRNFIASIHTTAKTVSVALIDLLSQPQYIEELRNEAKNSRLPDGLLDVDRLFKMDCFLKESQRLTPVFVLTMNRIVTQPYTFKVSGNYVPKGTLTVAATGAIATDPDTFGIDANGFDGARFERLRLDRTGQSNLKMGMATEDSLGFGLGSQACPGRFLAVNQIKILLAKLLLDYDLTLEKQGQTYTGGRPTYEYNDFSVIPPVQYGVKLRKQGPEEI